MHHHTGPRDSGASIPQIPLSSLPRDHTVQHAGWITREDLISSPGLKNVAQGTVQTNDIERGLVPKQEYEAGLPVSLRIFVRQVFRCDMGLEFLNASAPPQNVSAQDRGAPPPPPGAGPDANSAKADTLSYFLATLLVKAVPQTWHRAPHEFMLTQFLKSHGATRKVNNFLASLGLCLSDSQCSKREEVVVKALRDHDTIPKFLRIVAVAFNNCDMKAAMSLIGPQYLPLIACTAVALEPVEGAQRVLRLSPYSEWTKVKDLTMEEVGDGFPRDNIPVVFEEHLIDLGSACMSAVRYWKSEETCMEAKHRKCEWWSRMFFFQNCAGDPVLISLLHTNDMSP